MHLQARNGWKPLSLIALAALAACGGDGGGSGPETGPSAKYNAEIRRTAMGIPHIKAKDWLGLGYGSGYAQAQDNLCTMADSFTTYRGERSSYFGASAKAVNSSTIKQPVNLDSDFFFRHVISDDVVKEMREAQTTEIKQLVEGFVAGYNRVVREVKGGGKEHAACATQDWVKPISTDDLWRRMYAANLAGGYSNFVAQIATAQPPAAVVASAATTAGKNGARAASATQTQLAALPSQPFAAHELEVGGTRGIGSNMYGFGQQATGGSSVLFGNPHWYWKGPDRFYQSQLTIPGQIDVSGASFLGIPLVLIGFNNDVAWSHTVSTAKRFGVFMYQLDPSNPTKYLRDGKYEPMQAQEITVNVLNAAPVKRTLYKTVHGPVLNLGPISPALSWNSKQAFSIRDINAFNYRTFKNWLGWNQAKSLDEFIAIQKNESAIPWVNTVAAARDSADVWYADIGAVPNVSSQQLKQCETPYSAALNSPQVLPDVPVLLGSSKACDWVSDPDSKQEGAIGPSRMPSLKRQDYVANMNDSYWLANAKAPLTGFPSIFGSTNATQSLRTRMGHEMALMRLDGSDGYSGKLATSEIVRQMVLDSRVYSARFKNDVLALACDQPSVSLGGEVVQVGAACAALNAWDGRGTVKSKGSHVWDELWKRAVNPGIYATPFNAADPLNTPSGIKSDTATVSALKTALGQAVKAINAGGIALDAERGSVLFSARGGDKIPLYGGCGEVGYFTITCSEKKIENGGYDMDGQPHGNSYMQVVSFPANGVEAHTFLTFSVSDDPASKHYVDYTKAYGEQKWVKLPFTDSAIAASPGYTIRSISE
ncbi:penicillin acylase family protein [Comamonas composti]|uniref:penicillin acylase family protein n=1 Tax=Comamonas composti TaxID=408558 RepID=UPI0003F7EB4C|nr:penicillin acylase family protein [Comamonas composti]